MNQPTGHLVNWRRIAIWRELHKPFASGRAIGKRRSMTPDTRRKLLDQSPIVTAHKRSYAP